jgi:hypothetical protein
VELNSCACLGFNRAHPDCTEARCVSLEEPHSRDYFFDFGSGKQV